MALFFSILFELSKTGSDRKSQAVSLSGMPGQSAEFSQYNRDIVGGFAGKGLSSHSKSGYFFTGPFIRQININHQIRVYGGKQFKRWTPECANDRYFRCRRRPVACVCSADKLVARPDCKNHLGKARCKTDNAEFAGGTFSLFSFLLVASGFNEEQKSEEKKQEIVTAEGVAHSTEVSVSD